MTNFKHKATEKVYTILDHAKLDGFVQEFIIYRSVESPTDIYVRSREEFFDGRFEEVADVPEPPKYIWELIRLGLQDLQTIKENPEYTVNMGNYHSVGISSCHVCLVGSIMSQTLNADITKTLRPSNMPLEWQDPLDCLESVRTGRLKSAKIVWGEGFGKVVGLPDKYYIPVYSNSNNHFEKALHSLADLLESLHNHNTENNEASNG